MEKIYWPPNSVAQGLGGIAGRMRTNSRVGTYAYANVGRAEHAPSTITPASGPAQGLTYDANGNMTTGLDGKVMAYDGENRPVSVSFAGRTTAYVYGADGARLKKVETDPLTGTSVTLYMGPAPPPPPALWTVPRLPPSLAVQEGAG